MSIVMMTTEQKLFDHIERLIDLHQRNDCVWSDFFMACKDRLARDRMFGCDFLITAWGGMFNYDEFGQVENEQDEKLRRMLADETYNMAKELKNDQN